MKTGPSFLTTITLTLPLALFIPCKPLAQTNKESKTLPNITFEDNFQFSGGTPQQFLEAIERHYNKEAKVAWLAAASKLKDDYPDSLQAVEKALNDLTVDWLSIAEIPPEMDQARLPAMRTFSREATATEIGFASTESGVAYPYLEGYMKRRLANWVTIYNRLAEQKPELGMLVVEGDWAKPTVVMLALNKAFASTQPEVKFKAFALKQIPEKEWPKLLKDIDQAKDEARNYTQSVGGRATRQGEVSIHPATGLLVAHGPQSFVDMVGSVMTAYVDNLNTQPVEAKPSAPKK